MTPEVGGAGTIHIQVHVNDISRTEQWPICVTVFGSSRLLLN